MTPFLYVIRHGQTDANAENRLLGRLDLPLNAMGLEHAAHVSNYLKPLDIGRIYTSPLQRASRTADIIAEATGAPVVTDDRLIEMDFGDLDGMKIEEAIRNGAYGQRDRNRMDFLAPNGESYRQVAARVAGFFSMIEASPLDRPIAVVAHQGVNRMIAAHLGMMTQEEAAKLKIGHETILTVCRGDNQKITGRIEDISHEGI